MSNSPMKIIGFDPSLRNWGYCLAYYDKDSHKLSISTGKVIKTVKSQDKTTQNIKDFKTASELFTALFTLVNQEKPDLIIAELPTGSQSSRAMVSYAMCIALLASITKQIPLNIVKPSQIKRTVGNHKASKQEVIDWVFTHYPYCTWLNQLPKNQQEHICDAIVATHTYLFNGANT